MYALGAARLGLMLLCWSAACSASDGSSKTAVNAVTAAVLSDTNAAFFMLDLRSSAYKHLQVAVGPALLSPEGAASEYQFRGELTLSMQVGRFLLDDRNLFVWNEGGTMRYRNRLRLTAPAHFGERPFRAQLFGETYHESGAAGWFRNTVGVGAGFNFKQPRSVDVFWIHVNSDHQRSYSMLQLIVSMRIRG